MNRHVTIKKIAELLDCSTKTVKRKVDKGLIPAIQPDGPGTHIRFDIDDVLRAVKNGPPAYEASADSNNTSLTTERLSGPSPRWKQK